MSQFLKGFLVGGILAGSYVLLNVGQPGAKTRQQIREYIETVKNETEQVAQDTQRIQQAMNRLTDTAIPSVQKTVKETQRLATQFEQNSRPRLRRLKECFNDLQTHMQEAVQIFE